MAKPAARAPSRPEPKKPSTAVTRTGQGGDLAVIPEHLRGTGGQGTESIRGSDVALPLIKLAQAISEELNAIDGLKPGDFFHTITEEILGPEIDLVIVYSDIRAMLWRPRESGGGILARTDDLVKWQPSNAVFDVQLKNKKTVKWATKSNVVESRLLEFGTSDPDDPQSQPAGTRMYNMCCMLTDFPHLSPSIVTNQRSQIKAAKAVLGKLKMSRVAAWGQRFKLQSIEDQGPSGPFFNVRYVANGFVEDADEAALYREFYEKFLKDAPKIRDEDLENAAADVSGAEGTTGAPADRPKY